jgi:DNA-binding MarR family transcriptional regulator
MMYEEALENNKLTPVQFEVLLYVDSCAPCSVSDVAQFMVVDKSTSSRVLRGIQDKGLIEVDHDAEDRRRRRVSLTEEGKDLVDSGKKQWLQIEKDVCQKYDEAIEHLERF